MMALEGLLMKNYSTLAYGALLAVCMAAVSGVAAAGASSDDKGAIEALENRGQ